MPLTNAQKQAAHRQREKAKVVRYEAALREIADGVAWDSESNFPQIAYDALNPEPNA